jgi:regulatory protein
MPPKKKWKKRLTSSNGFTSELEDRTLLSEKELLELALRKLTLRPHAIVELKRQLLQHSENEMLIDSIIQRLTRCGYLDDRKLAEAFVQAGFEQKLHARSRIEEELTARGVDPNLVRKALQEHFPSSEEPGQLSRAMEKKLKTLTLPLDTKSLSRLYNYLVRQGFSEESIHQELERRFGDEPDLLRERKRN